MEDNQQLKAGEKGVWISIVAYLLLAIVKVIVGISGHSSSLLADGLNNATDVVASVAVLIGLKIARKPPDDNHPYGHYRAETVASLIAAFILMTVGLQVFIEALKSVLFATKETPDLLTGWVALGSGVFMFLVFIYNYQLGKKSNRSSVQALAQDNLADAIVSAGVFVGIMGSQFGWFLLDSIVAFLVGVIIIRTAISIFRKAALELTDGFDTDVLEDIRETLQQQTSIQKVKSLRARNHSNQTFVDLVIVLDETLNVQDSHAITEDIEKVLHDNHRIQHVHIHIEPK